QRSLQRQAQKHNEYAESGVKQHPRKQHAIDSGVVAQGMKFGDVLDERRSQTEIEKTEGTGENRQQHPGAEISHVEMGENVRGQQQGGKKTPETAEDVEKRVGDELLRKVTVKRDRLRVCR